MLGGFALLINQRQVNELPADRLVRMDGYCVGTLAQDCTQGLGDIVHFIMANEILHPEDRFAIDVHFSVFVVRDNHCGALQVRHGAVERFAQVDI